eukprot:4271162-Lingulodinium_polyedra.AAC.1
MRAPGGPPAAFESASSVATTVVLVANPPVAVGQSGPAPPCGPAACARSFRTAATGQSADGQQH